MTYEYVKPVASDGLRLHLNENTAGCSPRVLEVLRDATREQVAFYPDYDRAAQASAARLGVAVDNVLLTNGLDEGILLTALAALRGCPAADPFEAIVVQPAFGMYAACTDAVGGRVVNVGPLPDFSFPLQGVINAITQRTRLVFLTNPNNPTGLSISREAVVAIAEAAPDALVLLDEAYADFSGNTMAPAAASGIVSNLIVGRTFAKAYGLAGLRVGALVATPDRLAPMRRAVPPYSLNALAAAALPAACEDRDYFDWYLGEVRASKQLLYEAFARSGVRFWPGDGNFVLACFGKDLPRVIARLAALDIVIRDQSADPGCDGCARITAGVLEHTTRLVSALEEVSCSGAR
jgi:histidinol-phosphate aminotransferase